MERQPVPSSSIASVGYDPRSRTLEVEFASGAVYQLYDVPEQVHAGLVGADSVGRYYNQHVRGAYPYARL